jgi:iron(III) transport system substrate-binding protein
MIHASNSGAGRDFARSPITRRTAMKGALLLGASSIAAGCASNTAKPSAQNTDLIGLASKDEFDAELVKAAKKEGSVTFYTSQADAILAATTDAFTKKFGIKVNAYRATAADVVVRATQEFQAHRLAADVIDASSIASFLTMAELGMLEKFRPPQTANLADASFAATDQTWTACRISFAVNIWNTDMVKSGPTTWAALADPQWSQKLATWFDTAGSDAPWLYTVQQNLGADLLKNIAETKPLLTSSQPTLAQAVAQGQRPVGFSIGEDQVYTIKQKSTNIDFAYPEDAAIPVLGAVAKTLNSKNTAAGLLFTNWWLSTDAQDIQTKAGKYSPMKNAAPPPGSPNITSLKLVPVDDAGIAKNRNAIVSQIHAVFGR